MYIDDKEVFKIKTNLTIDIHDAKTMEIIETIKDHNLITTAGKNLVRDLLGIAVGITGINYFAVGTDNTSPSVTDTTLGAEVFRNTFTDVVYSSAKVTFKYFLGSTEANGNTLVEAGLFGDNATASTDSGTLFSHVTYTPIVKTSALAVTFSWDITIS